MLEETWGEGQYATGMDLQKADYWASGEINWLFDVLATDRETTGSVISNFKQVVKEGELKVHPIISRLVDKELLEKMTRHAETGKKLKE